MRTLSLLLLLFCAAATTQASPMIWQIDDPIPLGTVNGRSGPVAIDTLLTGTFEFDAMTGQYAELAGLTRIGEAVVDGVPQGTLLTTHRYQHPGLLDLPWPLQTPAPPGLNFGNEPLSDTVARFFNVDLANLFDTNGKLISSIPQLEFTASVALYFDQPLGSSGGQQIPFTLRTGGIVCFQVEECFYSEAGTVRGTISSIPEPETLLVLLTGLLAALGIRARKRGD